MHLSLWTQPIRFVEVFWMLSDLIWACIINRLLHHAHTSGHFIVAWGGESFFILGLICHRWPKILSFHGVVSWLLRVILSVLNFNLRLSQSIAHSFRRGRRQRWKFLLWYTFLILASPDVVRSVVLFLKLASWLLCLVRRRLKCKAVSRSGQIVLNLVDVKRSYLRLAPRNLHFIFSKI